MVVSFRGLGSSKRLTLTVTQPASTSSRIPARIREFMALARINQLSGAWPPAPPGFFARACGALGPPLPLLIDYVARGCNAAFSAKELLQNLGLPKTVILSEAKNLVFLVT